MFGPTGLARKQAQPERRPTQSRVDLDRIDIGLYKMQVTLWKCRMENGGEAREKKGKTTGVEKK